MSFGGEPRHEHISTTLEVEQLDTTQFRSKSLWLPKQGRVVYGGQIISQALVCATRLVDPSYALHSVHSHFLLGASPLIPIFYSVKQRRQGRTYTTCSVKASQSGNCIFVMTCSFQKPDPQQLVLAHQLPFPLDVPPPGNLPNEETKFEAYLRDNVNASDSLTRTYYEYAVQDGRGLPIEIRFATERTSEAGEYVIMWWMKVRKTRGMPDKFEQPFQKCIIAFVSDMKFGATPLRALGIFKAKGPRGHAMATSLAHSIMYYGNDIDCSGWLLLVMTSPVSGNGRGIACARIYAQSGALIAITSQELKVQVDPKYVQLEQEEAKAAKL